MQSTPHRQPPTIHTSTHQSHEEVQSQDARKRAPDDDCVASPQVHGAAEQLPRGDGVLVREGGPDVGHAPGPHEDEDAEDGEVRDAEVLGERHAVKQPHPGADGHPDGHAILGADGVDQGDLAAHPHGQPRADVNRQPRPKEGEQPHRVGHSDPREDTNAGSHINVAPANALGSKHQVGRVRAACMDGIGGSNELMVGFRTGRGKLGRIHK